MRVLSHLMVFLTATYSAAEAEFETGNTLYAQCSVREGDPTYYMKDAACLQYVVGIIDMIELQQQMSDASGKRAPRCVPAGVTKGQVRDIAVQYITNNPDERHYEAAALVWNGLIAAFPCK
jgi:hypothetical protein